MSSEISLENLIQEKKQNEFILRLAIVNRDDLKRVYDETINELEPFGNIERKQSHKVLSEILKLKNNIEVLDKEINTFKSKLLWIEHRIEWRNKNKV